MGRAYFPASLVLGTYMPYSQTYYNYNKSVFPNLGK